MKRYLSLITAGYLLVALSFVVPATVHAAEAWKIDADHSAAHFSIRHMMIAQVRGAFPAVEGTVTFDGETPIAFDVTIDVNSLDTGVVKRDEHLKSSDFFEAASYPVMTFVSRTVSPYGGNGGFVATGDVTIKGVTRNVDIMITGLGDTRKDPWGGIRKGGKAELTIDRRDYNIVWNAPMEGGGLLVGNKVEIVVDFEVVKLAK